MTKCVSCNGENILQGARFCVHCGARLDLQNAPAQPPTPAAPPPPTPAAPPTPPSVRITTDGNTTMAAPSSYSFVAEREEIASRRVSRATLPGASRTPARVADQTPGAAAPSSMAEALARVSHDTTPTPARPPSPPATDQAPMSASARRAFGKTLVAGSPTPPPRPAAAQPGNALPSWSAPANPEQSSQPQAAAQDPSTTATWTGESVEPERDLTWSPPADPASTPVVRVDPPARVIRSPFASTFGGQTPRDLNKTPVSGTPEVGEAMSARAAPAVEIVVGEMSPAEAAEAEQIARISELPGDPFAANADGSPESVDALLDDIDAGFDRIVDRPGSKPPRELTEHETKEVKDLFTQIAAGQMRPVRDFVIELKLGEPPREWIDVVMPAVSSLGRSAKGMGLADLEVATRNFLEALELASTEAAAVVAGDARTIILESYEGLAATMPDAFALDEERDRREPIIVQSLLKQVHDVRKVALDKLYAAGLTSLEMYYQAKAYDIAQAAGLPEELAERIVRRFSQYRREIATAAPDLERSHEHKKLAVLTARLSNQNEAFAAASLSWSADATRKKKRVRKERNETVLEVNVLLARLGGVDLVKEIEKLPFQGKVDALKAYLEEAKAKAEQGGGGPMG